MSVVMTIIETQPAVKGDTKTNTLKAATVETGYVVQVPLFINNGDKISVGQPTVKGASVTAEIVEHRRGEKVRIFKFKRRREYRKRRGYRDDLTRIRVTSIKG